MQVNVSWSIPRQHFDFRSVTVTILLIITVKFGCVSVSCSSTFCSRARALPLTTVDSFAVTQHSWMSVKKRLSSKISLCLKNKAFCGQWLCDPLCGLCHPESRGFCDVIENGFQERKARATWKHMPTFVIRLIFQSLCFTSNRKKEEFSHAELGLELMRSTHLPPT